MSPDQGQTDIGELTKILDTTKEPERVQFVDLML